MPSYSMAGENVRFSTIATAILFVGLILIAFGSFGDDINRTYSQHEATDINTSFASKFQYSGAINSSAASLVESFNTIGDTDASFITKLGTGILAIPRVAFLFIGVTLSVFQYGTSMITDIGVTLYLTSAIIFILLTIFVVYITFKLVEFVKGAPT